VRERLGDPALVLIVPDGALNLLNFSALPAPDGGYLAEGEPVLHTLSAERDIAALPGSAPLGTNLLALGAPDFDDPPDDLSSIVRSTESATFRGETPDCDAFRSTRFQPLPRTRLEIDQVASLWEELRAKRPGRALTLTDSRASEAAFKSFAPEAQILHIATHGVFFESDCVTESNGDPAADSGRLPDAPARDALRSFAALALAGANRRAEASPSEEDGILTSQEVASLDLTQVEWAVLSACESGKGKVFSREGMFGLRRSFLVAGVRTVIASLWKVRDEDTRVWVEGLYRARAAGRPTPEAVREADLAVIRARRNNGLSTHPFYWGAFVASGDWR
jgi:CHAT domain-containing protein